MYSIWIFVWMSVNFVDANQMPESIKPFRCKSDMAVLDRCVLDNGNKAIPVIVEGIPELHIPKLNPMSIEFIELINTPMLHMNLTKIKIHGLPDVVMKDAKADLKGGILQGDLKGKNITIEGLYTADGKISVMPIEGSGHFSLYLKNGLFKAYIRFNLVDGENNSKYFKRQEVGLDYEFDDIVFNFENLMAGNPTLGEQINKFLNENWKKMLSEFGPGIVDILIVILGNLFDQFATVPLNDYFLKD